MSLRKICVVATALALSSIATAAMPAGNAAEPLPPMSDMECSAFFLPTGATHDMTSAGLTILYDGFRRSMIEPCSCVSNQLGGYDRQMKVATMLAETGRGYSYVDAGGFLRDAPASASNVPTAIPDEYLTRTLSLMKMQQLAGVEAVNVGFMDLGAGIDFVRGLQDEYKTPFISANLRDAKTQERLFAPYVITEKTTGSGTKIRVAYLGVTRSNVYPNMPAVLNKNTPYTVDDVTATINEFVPQLREKADFVVVLYYARITAEPAIKSIKDIADNAKPDLVICSEFHGLKPTVEMMGSIGVVSCGYEGRNLGNLLVTFDEALKPLKYYNKVIDIRTSIPAVAPYDGIVSETLVRINEARRRPAGVGVNKINLD